MRPITNTMAYRRPLLRQGGIKMQGFTGKEEGGYPQRGGSSQT
jgi:hypothetical protein